MTRHLHSVPTPPLEDDVRAMPQAARSGVLRTEPLRVAALRAPAAIAGPSQAFVSLTRNPHLEPPSRFEPTVKAEGDIVL
jgi:hypothetical protein